MGLPSSIGRPTALLLMAAQYRESELREQFGYTFSQDWKRSHELEVFRFRFKGLKLKCENAWERW